MTSEKIKNYFNKEYFEYWFGATNKEKGRKDVPKDEIFKKYIDMLQIKEGDTILDVGCGFGRCFSLFLEKKAEVYGIDISEAMISEAKKIHDSNPHIHLSCGDAEELKFQDNMFNKIIFWGVFDAVENQHRSLSELSRILKNNGELLVSGKHKPYNEDDKEAKVAEINAAKKEHPNFFTDFEKLKQTLKENNLEIKNSFIFERRGDMAQDRYLTEIPEIFYEYVLILEKNNQD